MNSSSGKDRSTGKTDVTKTVSIDPDSIIASSLENQLNIIPPEKKESWKYEIKDELGRGGIGRVLIAFDDRIGREIALKELIKTDNPGKITALPDDSKLKADEIRFLREAKVTGQLEHPGIVPVYEIGRKPDGNHYYTMKLVRGMTLAQAIHDAGNLENRLRLLPHFRDICNAIAYSHSRGVIHRDLKPDNIMIGEFGETVVLDWGLAKVRGETDETETELREELTMLKVEHVGRTARGRAIGTPAYMPPEQAKGEIPEIDERSDIYSLGAVLYEILTGHPPFKGRDIKETLEMVKKGVPVEIRIYEPDAPMDLCAVVSKTLTPVKADRYQSAIEVAREIENFMSGGRINAYEYSSWELFKRFIRKNRALSGLIGVFAIVLLAGSLIVLYAYRESVKNERAAHLNLSLGYLEYAEKLIREKNFSGASVFAAASLYHNPFNPGSPWRYPPSYVNENSEESSAQMLSMQSALYLSNVHQNDAFKADIVSVSFDARDIAVSPDGSMIAVAGKKKEIYVYFASNGKLKFILDGHKDEVSAIEFSPDGKYLASGSYDRMLNLWNAKEGVLLRSFHAPNGEIYAISFSPDSERIAFGGTEKNLWIVNINESELSAKKVFQSESSIRAVDWSPDGSMTIVSDSAGGVYLLKSGQVLKSFKNHREPVIALKFLKDNIHFISTGYDKKLLVWDIESDVPVSVLDHWDAFFDLDVSADGTLAAASTRDGIIKLINLKTRQIAELRGHEGSVFGASFLPMGDAIVSIGEDRVIKLWKTDIRKQVFTFRGHMTYIPSLSYSPDGRYLASSSWDSTIKLWNVGAESLHSSFGIPKIVSYSIAFSPDGQYIATGDSDGMIRIWNPQNGKVLETMNGHTDQVSSIAFSPDSRYIVSGSKDRTVRIWDAGKGSQMSVLKHSTPVLAVAISRDGMTLLSGGRNGDLSFWDMRNGKNIFSVKGVSKNILSIAVSPDSKFAVTATEDGKLYKWDMVSKKNTAVVAGHEGPANMVVFSPDGKLFASVGKDVILWDAKNFEKIQVIDLQYNGYSVAFENDGKYFSVSDGAVIKRYPVILGMWKKDPAKLLEEAQAQTGKILQGFKLVPSKTLSK